MIRAMTCIAVLLAAGACGPNGDRYDDEPDFRTVPQEQRWQDTMRDTLDDSLFRDTIMRRDTTDTNRT